ncbi:hypothetical protein BDAP_000608 [Binucleata daphniae]
MKNKNVCSNFIDSFSFAVLIASSASLAYTVYSKYLKVQPESKNHLKCLYEQKKYDKILSLTINTDQIDLLKFRYESLAKLKMYKQLFYEKIKNNCKETKELENILKKAVDYDFEKYKNTRFVSDVAVSESFECFVNLFSDFEDEKQKNTASSNLQEINQIALDNFNNQIRMINVYEKPNKEEIIGCKFTSVKIQLVKKNKITKSVFEKIQKFVTTKDYAELEKYVCYKTDNLSILILMILSMVKNNEEMHDLRRKVNEVYKTKYETKIHTYCCVLYDYYTKKDNKYVFEDVTTFFYKYKQKNNDCQMYLKELLQKGVYPFIYIDLLKENKTFIDETYAMFPTNCQILSFMFEIYVAAQEYKKADSVLKSLVKYHKNDPRTFVCIFFKELVVDSKNIDKQYKILHDAYKIDKKYYRTMYLIGQLYYMKNNEISKKWLKKAIFCCNDNVDKRKIIEMLTLIKIQTKLDKLQQ